VADFSKSSDPAANALKDWCLPNRLAYVVSHAFPYANNGYAVRTHAVARALVAQGVEVIVFSKPGRPWDINGFPPRASVKLDQTIDGVRYICLPLPTHNEVTRSGTLKRVEAGLRQAFDVFRPAMVMAASDWRNAVPAQRAARRINAAFFYEQRGFWELSRAEYDPAFAGSDEMKSEQASDAEVSRSARAVFTLNSLMRDELIERGIPRNKINIVPNGVFEPSKVPASISRRSLGLNTAHLIGYVGSLSPYEGVEDIVHLVAKLRAGGTDVGAMIVGSSAPQGVVGTAHDAASERSLKALVDALELTDYIRFIPTVTDKDAAGYFSLAEAIILPRRETAVTRLVPPIKPFVAAGFRIPLFVSNIPPLVEIADELNGTVFELGDIDGLADLVRPVLERGSTASMSRFPRSAFWPAKVQPMVDLFAQTTKAAKARGLAITSAAGGAGGLFDMTGLPKVMLREAEREQTVVCLGPGEDIDATRVVHVTRQTLLDTLATEDVGVFVIDWNGLQTDPAAWDGLWSIDAMRLNRLVMDACRIGLDRGWDMRVLGPVNRSKSPLFRTVSPVLTEIDTTAPASDDPLLDSDMEEIE
jgi:glycosyltransferase involved in cell wall biosynthesis